MRLVGEEVKSVNAFTLKSVSGEASVAYGSAFDRLGYLSAKFDVQTGTVTGSPTNGLITFGIQECDTETGTFEDVSLSGTYTITGEAASINESLLTYEQDLRGLKRWLKTTVTPSWTGGSTPTIPVGVVATLGEAAVQPAA